MGFLPGRSSISAICDVYSVYFDHRKVFVTFPIIHCCRSSFDIQLSLHTIQWVSSYLSNRSQLLVVESSTCSPILPVLSGVPQGPVPGPLLFLILVKWHKYHQVAVTLCIYFSIVQRDISSKSSCIRNKFLSLQRAKCHNDDHPQLIPNRGSFSYIDSMQKTFLSHMSSAHVPAHIAM